MIASHCFNNILLGCYSTEQEFLRLRMEQKFDAVSGINRLRSSCTIKICITRLWESPPFFYFCDVLSGPSLSCRICSTEQEFLRLRMEQKFDAVSDINRLRSSCTIKICITRLWESPPFLYFCDVLSGPSLSCRICSTEQEFLRLRMEQKFDAVSDINRLRSSCTIKICITRLWESPPFVISKYRRIDDIH
ncbi:uncharacterized protein G2W53_014264 [Senna tora]|uniref:Uncharacterized protein n=1 Tax=Senna tora TaxID=362788 RepID=A0A835C642_9FABA|nr:uncharacterized protein G2W53_014264 [Senna tora]